MGQLPKGLCAERKAVCFWANPSPDAARVRMGESVFGLVRPGGASLAWQRAAPKVRPTLTNTPAARKTRCRKATWRGMLKLLEMGKKGGSRAVGVSNFEKDHLMDLMDVGGPDKMPSVNQVEYHPWWHGEQALACSFLVFALLPCAPQVGRCPQKKRGSAVAFGAPASISVPPEGVVALGPAGVHRR